MTKIIHELSADHKQHRLVVVPDGGTTLTSEQVRVEQAAKVFFEAAELLEPLIEIFFAIEPVLNVSPRFRPAVDQRQIRAPDNFVEGAKCFRKQIAELHFDLWRNPRQSGADATRGAIVTLPKSGSEDQNSFHDAIVDFSRAVRLEVNGYFRSAK